MLTASDIKTQLSGKDLGEKLLICKSMLMAKDNIFLDNVTVPDLEDYLHTKISVVPNSGVDFIEKIHWYCIELNKIIIWSE